MAPISLVDLPVSRTGPDPSGSAGSSRLCRGCSHPPRQPADQAASSFTPPLRRQGHGVFHLHPKQQRLVAQSYVFDMCRTSSSSSLTTCDFVSQPSPSSTPSIEGTSSSSSPPATTSPASSHSQECLAGPSVPAAATSHAPGAPRRARGVCLVRPANGAGSCARPQGELQQVRG